MGGAFAPSIANLLPGVSGVVSKAGPLTVLLGHVTSG